MISGLLLLAILAQEGSVRVGDPMPEINVRTLDQQAVGEAAPDQVTIVDFFATWCGSCRRSLDDYDRLMETFRDRVRLVIVDVGEPAADVRAFFTRNVAPLGAVVALDENSELFRRWGVRTFPSAFVVDRGGVVRAKHVGWGARGLAGITRVVRGLLAADGGAPRASRGAAPAAGRPRPRRGSETHDERARRLGVEILR